MKCVGAMLYLKVICKILYDIGKFNKMYDCGQELENLTDMKQLQQQMVYTMNTIKQGRKTREELRAGNSFSFFCFCTVCICSYPNVLLMCLKW